MICSLIIFIIVKIIIVLSSCLTSGQAIETVISVIIVTMIIINNSFMIISSNNLDLDLGVADSDGDWPPRPLAGLRLAWYVVIMCDHVVIIARFESSIWLDLIKSITKIAKLPYNSSIPSIPGIPDIQSIPSISGLLILYLA